MDLNEKVLENEKRLTVVENDVQGLKEDLETGFRRFDESNRYLREQNRDILKEIIKRNNFADKQDFEIKKITKQNQLKMFGMIFSASGLAALFLEFLLKIFK